MQYNIIISGQVQGVSYRYYTHRQAELIDVKGYVQNQLNGSVKIIAQGEKHQLDDLVKWCSKGSPYSKVSDVYVEETKPIKTFNSFTIKY